MRGTVCALVLSIAGCKSTPQPNPAPTKTDTLQPLSAFDSLSGATRSRALFMESTKVLLHPRCANCHPAGDSPLQGMDQHVHYPPVSRGPKDDGVVGMQCGTCHQEANQELIRVPGAPKWHVAPLEMAWVGRSPREICAQVKDVKRNGGKSLAQLHEHMAHDELVAWAWNPGSGREPAPGTQQQLGELIGAWIDSGAHCPE
ncbi:MAG: Isoquinoline 1-oxidoreductase subunit [Archangium sp.]